MKNWFKILRDSLSVTAVKTMSVDGSERLHVHRQVIANKPILHRAMHDIHRKMISLASNPETGAGKKIELGAGVCPLKLHDPDILSSDIVPCEENDLVLDATNLKLASSSVSYIFCQNSFHHFPDPQRFFEECDRVLTIKGRVIILDPYYGKLAAFLFKRLFNNEKFDKSGEWNQIGNGPMSNANQALSYIVFRRDRNKFEKLNPNLKIVLEFPSGTHLSYLLSGGLNFTQIVPNCFIGLVFFIEGLVQPLNKLISIHHFIVIEKVK